jgi:4-hydroxy-tetrahydrodipicolinate synthase
MKTDFLKGSWVALVTPFKDDFSIDFDAVEKMVRFHLEAQTDGLLVCGTTGEAATMTFAEKEALMKFVRKMVGNKVPIMFGCGSNNTATSVELTSKAVQLGADAVLVVTPYYNKPPQAGLVAHFTQVAEATSLPVVLYNVPGRTGCNMLPETVAQLAKIQNVVAVKEASGNLNQVMEIIRLVPGDFRLFSGEDALNLPIMACGGTGTISVTANVAPKMMKKFNDFALDGNLEAARQVHYQLLDLHRNLFCEANPLPAKSALKTLGLMGDAVRLPLCKPSYETEELMKKTIVGLE